MPATILQQYSPRKDETPEQRLKALTNAYYETVEQLNWLLKNLDQTNVVRAKSVVTDWVYAGNVTTNQIIAGSAKIGAALIEELVVGDNVTMGPDAYIAWDHVTSQPNISSLALDAWEASGYATYINSSGVYSGVFAGGMFEINPLSNPALESGLTIGGYYNYEWTGEALRLEYDEDGNGGTPCTTFSSGGGVPLLFNVAVKFLTDVDFMNVTVSNLNVAARYA